MYGASARLVPHADDDGRWSIVERHSGTRSVLLIDARTWQPASTGRVAPCVATCLRAVADVRLQGGSVVFLDSYPPQRPVTSYVRSDNDVLVRRRAADVQSAVGFRPRVFVCGETAPALFDWLDDTTLMRGAKQLFSLHDSQCAPSGVPSKATRVELAELTLFL